MTAFTKAGDGNDQETPGLSAPRLRRQDHNPLKSNRYTRKSSNSTALPTERCGCDFVTEQERVYGGGRGQRTAAMHGKLALYHSQYGVIPIAVSLLAIIWTTAFLTWIQTYLVADEVED